MSMPVEFVADSEPWCRYTLDDGTVLRVRVMLVKCQRDGLNDDGTPRYMCQFQQVLDMTPSELAIQSAKEQAGQK